MARRAPKLNITFDGKDLTVSLEGVGVIAKRGPNRDVDFARAWMDRAR